MPWRAQFVRSFLERDLPQLGIIIPAYGFDNIWYSVHNRAVAWIGIFHPEFDAEFQAMEESLQDEMLAHAKLLQDFGPNLGRPAVDTLDEHLAALKGTAVKR